MLGEESVSQIYKYSFSTSKLTSKTLVKLLSKILDNRNNISYGKQSLKSLNKKNRELIDISLDKVDLKGIKKELNKYGVDFAITKTNDKNKYDLYFKAQDVGQINKALQKFTSNKLTKESIKDRIERATAKCNQYNKQNQKEHSKDRNKIIGRER